MQSIKETTRLIYDLLKFSNKNKDNKDIKYKSLFMNLKIKRVKTFKQPNDDIIVFEFSSKTSENICILTLKSKMKIAEIEELIKEYINRDQEWGTGFNRGYLLYSNYIISNILNAN